MVRSIGRLLLSFFRKSRLQKLHKFDNRDYRERQNDCHKVLFPTDFSQAKRFRKEGHFAYEYGGNKRAYRRQNERQIEALHREQALSLRTHIQAMEHFG